MTGHKIRPAISADRKRIEAIIEAAYSPYIERMGCRPGPMLDDYAKRIDAGQTHVLEDDGSIAGVLVLEPAEDHLLLDNVAVGPEQHGKGFGRLLMTFAEAEALRQGYDRMVLYTHVLMVENLALYQRLGYVETGRHRVSGYDRVYMQKVLR